MEVGDAAGAGVAAPQTEPAQHHQHATHSTPPGTQPQGTAEEARAQTTEGLNIQFTPDSQFDSQQLQQLLQGPPLSQDLMLGGTQNQDCSLQQEMLKAERESAERHQTREQEAAAALREEAAAQADPLLSGQAAAEGAFLGRNASGGMAVNDPAAAAAAAAAAGGAGVSEELLKLAQVAYDEQQGQQQAQDPYAAAMQAQFDPAAWAAFGGSMPMGMNPGMGMNPAMLGNYYWPGQAMAVPSAYPQTRHPSLSKPEHQGSNAKRRGPMDEMRQLQRILTKLLPGSIIYMPNQDGGGNKVQADDIKVYLAATLGEAPKPDWGLKNGWGQYLADLFNWATGREGDNAISRTQAMSCARRPQGRSWEVVFDKLMELGVYSWNWELPLRHEQVLNCHKTPPPELTRQQEALAAATAAAAAAAAVTAGTNPDAIPNLPVVARMASLLGKRQHQQMTPMSSLPMGPPPMMFGGMSMEGGGDVMAAAAAPSAAAAAAAAAASAAAAEGAAGGEAAAPEEPVAKKQRSSSSSAGLPMAQEAPAASSDGAAAAGAAGAAATAGAAAADAPPTRSTASAAAAAAAGGGGGGGVSDAELALPPLEVLQAASIQQLMTFIDNALTGALQATQAKVMSGTARCPSMEYVMNMKNFKLDPLYASYISLVMQASSTQAAMEQHLAQQAAMQQSKAKVKAEPAASSSRGMGPPTGASAAAPPPAAVPAPAAAAAAASASNAARQEAPAAAAAVSDAQGERDSGTAVAAAMAAAAAAAAAAASSMAAPAAVAAAKAGTTAQAAKALGKKKGAKAAARDPQQELVQQAKQQMLVQAAAAEAAMAAAARQQQKQAALDPVNGVGAAAAAQVLRRSLEGKAAAEAHRDSEDAALAAAMALSALAGSQEVPEGAELDYQQPGGGRGQAGGVAKRRVGGSRLANGSGRAAHTSPMKQR